MSATRLGNGIYFGYGLGTVATAIFSTLPGLLLLSFMVRQLAIPPALAAAVIFFPRLWDVITDPLVGSWSDRTRSRIGPRRPWLLAGMALMPVAFLMMFGDSGLSGQSAAMYMLVVYLVGTTAFTVFQVPYVALPAEMTQDYHERTTIMSWRIALLAVGILLSGGLAPALVEWSGGGRAGFEVMSIVIAAVVLISCASAYFTTGRLPVTPVKAQSASFREQFSAALSRPSYLSLLLAFVVQGLAVGCMLAAVEFYCVYQLGDASLTSTLFVCLVAPSLITMPIWAWVGRHKGKRFGYQLCTIIFALSGMSLLFADAEQMWSVYLRIVVMGTAYAGTQMFPLAMLPDAISDDQRRSGANRAGAFTGFWTAGEKVGLAMGAVVFALILGLAGFLEGENGALLVQPESAIVAINWGFAGIPSLLLLFSLILIRRYRLDDAHFYRQS